MRDVLKQRLLHDIWNVAAILAIAFFVLSRVPPLATALTTYATFYGDMFLLNKVRDFKIAIPKDPVALTTAPENADVVVIGDSFFNVHYEQPEFPYRLAAKTGLAMYHAPTDARYHTSPSVFFRDHPESKPRVVIWEQVERGVVDLHQRFEPSRTRDLLSLVPRSWKTTSVFRAYERGADAIFNTQPLYFFLENSRLTAPIYETLYTWRFHLNRDLSPRTPEFSLDPRMVFFDTELRNARRAVTDAELRAMADRVEREVSLLRDQNIATIVVILPSKYTVYRDLLSDHSYNQLLPRLEQELSTRDIPMINMLPAYEDAARIGDDFLYYPSDTHWTPEASDMLIERLSNKLSEMLPR